MSLELYSIIGIAVAGIVAEEIMHYKNKKLQEEYATRFKGLISHAQELQSQTHDMISRTIKSIDNLM